MKINLFAVNISALLNSPIDDWLKYFSVERREKILSYRFNADRNRTVWSELLVRCVVSEKFSCPIEKVKVNRDTKGKPHIEELPVEISLSHAGNWVVCSIGAHSSGVDVEVDSTAALEIAKNFFLPKEYEKIISLPENLRGRQFLIYWTIKESYFKLTAEENFLQADSEKILGGSGEVVGKNFFLNDGAVVGVCTYSTTPRNRNFEI
ncbi:MAG: 4'-phosphopantetheinyl transferase superfamily protein [Selenomonadaceae bacterium]|nr:4'-phosphopantetheinyl transferase superfamily protein [Selenomonadaceae bacterium]